MLLFYVNINVQIQARGWIATCDSFDADYDINDLGYS
jgi:hypothetical protein